MDRVTHQMKNLLLNQSTVEQVVPSFTPTQSLDVHSMQSMNTKGNQQPRGNKKRINNCRGWNNDRNSAYEDKNNDNASKDKDTKRKFKLPCKLCGGDHLMHSFPRI